jgi:hypothetical protein
MRSLLLLPLLACPALAASALTGFPFADETLAYSIKLPTGISLGEARMSAKHGTEGWAFELKGTAGLPGYVVRDDYTSWTNSDFCSTKFVRQYEHGARKGREEEAIDRSQETATRSTIVGINNSGGGGKSEFPVTDCTKDALTLLYYARRELGQGRVLPAQQFLFGGFYNIAMSYAGAETITVADQSAITDKIVCTVKGPASTFTFEMYFARDPARTPLLVKVPLPVGSISLELVR